MNKRVYSIVLSDDVVAAVDRMAYSMNTSRSNLINQILAQHCSYVTLKTSSGHLVKNRNLHAVTLLAVCIYGVKLFLENIRENEACDCNNTGKAGNDNYQSFLSGK